MLLHHSVFLFYTIVENWQESTRRDGIWPMLEHISCFVSREQHITLWATALLWFLSVNKCVVLVCSMYVHTCNCVDPFMVLQVSPQAFLQLKNISRAPQLQITGAASLPWGCYAGMSVCLCMRVHILTPSLPLSECNADRKGSSFSVMYRSQTTSISF